MASVFDSYAPYKGELARRNTGSLVASETGTSITYGLFNAQERGVLFIGPNVGIYTVTHALLPDQRNAGVMRSLPITIGDNVWIGGNCVVMQGVTIGDGTVIGAGSVVTRDIPAGVIAFGNPCRVIRPVTEDDRITEVV